MLTLKHGLNVMTNMSDGFGYIEIGLRIKRKIFIINIFIPVSSEQNSLWRPENVDVLSLREWINVQNYDE